MKASNCFLFICSISSLFLTAYGLRCHQCNSHLDPDCLNLRLNTPRPQLDDQYLRDCEVKADDSDGVAFCRKIDMAINVSKEKRIVRGCGYVKEDKRKHNMSCYDADNEGFTQRICICFQDGCNTATALATNRPVILFSAIPIIIFSLAKYFA